MAMKLMYITNDREVALIAEKYGVDRIWVDLETLGKEERQHGMNTVKSNHAIEDVKKIKSVLTTSELLVRINGWNKNSEEEIEKVIDGGADVIMLPMWKSVEEVGAFLKAVNKRAKTVLLLETAEAEQCLDTVLEKYRPDEIHIGLNDLHLSYGLTFMFELLANGTVERICKKLDRAGIPYGFGGIAKIGQGSLPAEKILFEHYRLGSSRVILSRSFCDTGVTKDIDLIEKIFKENLQEMREVEKVAAKADKNQFDKNAEEVKACVQKVVESMSGKKINNMLDKLMNEYGDAFYILDSLQFKKNFLELKKAFADIYPDFNIAYSYKTNYTPKLCRIVNELGGFAEVVSDMEMEIALGVGVAPENIIWNGPYKNTKKVEELLLRGGVVNLDNATDTENIRRIAEAYPDSNLRVGIRCNFDIGDGVVSRFGYDVESKEFADALALVREKKNLTLNGMQCHFATRALHTWRPRAEKMIALLDKHGLCPDYVDLGGGLFGKMDDSLKAQFDTKIPTYAEYAAEVAPIFKKRYENETKRPTLLIEPGSALVGDCMRFAARVSGIKTVRGKSIATLLGSIYNINPTLNKKNPPLTLVPVGRGERKRYDGLDFGGFTCIESDYLYRGYSGELAVGDIVVFGNVGSYSVVLKPPFILPNFPMLDIEDGKAEIVKRAENFDDLFHTFSFERS